MYYRMGLLTDPVQWTMITHREYSGNHQCSLLHFNDCMLEKEIRLK